MNLRRLRPAAPYVAVVVLPLGLLAFGPESPLGFVSLIAFLCLSGWLKWRDTSRDVKRAMAEMVAIPGPDADIDEILQFGRSTYRGDVRHRAEELAWIASTARSHWSRTGNAPDSAQIARAALYFESTQPGSAGSESSAADPAYLRALVSRIGLFVVDGRIAPDKPGALLLVRRWAAGAHQTER